MRRECAQTTGGARRATHGGLGQTYRRAIGEVNAHYAIDVGFRVSGKMVARLVEVGAARQN